MPPLVNSLDDTVYDVSLAALELFVYDLAFGVLHLLNDDLFCRLRRNTSQGVRIHPDAQFVAQLAFGVQVDGFLQGDFLVGVDDFFNHFLEQKSFEFAEFLVEGHIQVQSAAVLLPDSRFDGLFQRMNQCLAVDTLFPTHLVDQPLEFTGHGF